MKVINIRWRPFLTFCLVLVYMLLILIFLVFYVSETEPVPPLTSQFKPKLNHSMIKPIEKPEISSSSQPQLNNNNNWKQSLLAKSEITPRFLYNGGRKDVKFVIGVPTVLRSKENYVLETINYLIARMTPEERDNCLIVIHVGETSLQLGKFIVKELKAKHAEHLQSGLIDVIAPQLHYYPNFSNPQRVQLWTKQNLDYIYLMSYAQPKGSYYLQLEDNVMANEGFLDYMAKAALMHGIFRFDHQPDWIAISFSSDLGFVMGKLFPSSVLQSFITYLQLFYDHQPIDWLLQSFVSLQSCRWDSISQPKCQRKIESRIIQTEHSQFRHMNKKSQHHKASFINRNVEKQRLPLNLVASHRNSLLRQSLDLKPGETFIWMYMPKMPEMIKDLMSKQYKGTELRIRNHKTSAKTLPEFSVELKPGLDMNATSSCPQCGFLMSHTISSDNHLFYYIKEDKDTLTWLRAKDTCGTIRIDRILIYIWALFYLYLA